MRVIEPCACDEFALWYIDLKGTDGAVRDHVVCECGHATREHVASVGCCLGNVLIAIGHKDVYINGDIQI